MPDKIDARFLKKLKQISELIENEKRSGKTDWHSREHLARDLAAAAFAGNSNRK